MHGLEGSSRNWTDLIDLLRSRLACEAMDLPGFGDSPPRPDGRYSIAALAQTVIALAEKKQAPVHLIGNSLGGAVCVKVAAARPDLLKTLTLISPALPDSRPRLDLIRFPVMSLPRVGARVVKQYQVLPPNQFDVADERLRQQRIVQRGEEHQQRAPAQPHPQKSAQFVEIGRHQPRLECVKRVAAGVVMAFAVFCANKIFNFIAERHQAK